MGSFATVRDLRISSGTRVLVRSDFNVPLNKGKVGRDAVASAARIKAGVPTLTHLLDQGASLVVISHLGKPKGKVNAGLSMTPVAEVLADQLGRPVKFGYELYGQAVAKATAALKPGELLLLENTRYLPGEEEGDLALAQAVVESTGAEHFVLDGFSVAHRPHALVTGAAEIIKAQGGLAVAGLLVEQEFAGYDKVLNPETPAIAVMGGAKVTDKLQTLDALRAKMESLFVGGAMLYYFLRAKGLVEGMPDPLGLTRDETEQNIASARQALANDAEGRIKLPAVGQLVMDGLVFRDVTGLGAMIDAAGAKTAFWNGPIGMIEKEAYRAGTIEVVGALGRIPNVVVGGGDTESVNKFAQVPGFVSMAGGAGLELLAFGRLPGIDALSRLA